MSLNTGSDTSGDPNELKLPVLVINSINPRPIRELTGSGFRRNGQRIRFRELGNCSDDERDGGGFGGQSKRVGFGEREGDEGF